MTDKPNLKVDGMGSAPLPSGSTITPQPEPTSPRIKELLGRALTNPEKLTPAEVQEMAASVVYFLISMKRH